MDKHILEMCTKKINKKINNSWQELANKFGYQSGESLRCGFKAYRKKANLIPNKTDILPESNIINNDGSQVNEKVLKVKNKNDLRNPDFLLKEHNYNPDLFELTKATSSIWNNYSKAEGMQNLYSSKIWVKPRTTISLNSMKTQFIDMVKNYKPKGFTIIHETRNKEHTLEIPLFDVHLGKKSVSYETGINSDHKTIIQNIWQVVSNLIQKVNVQEIKQIIFPIGNDFFNYDTVNGTTTKGTPQDNSLHFQQMFLEGCKVIVDVITSLSQIAPVKVFYVPANHDEMTSFYLLSYLNAWFKENKNIEIDMNIKPRYYLTIGKSLVGFTHGNLEKKRIKSIMQVEAKKQWGNCEYAEWHCAHLHSEQATIEEGGLIIRHLSSITTSDRWHNNQGYVGAVRKLQGFLWHDEDGLVSIINSAVK